MSRFKYHLISRADNIKSNWFEWECEREDEAGNIVEGYIQADYSGEMIAEESFEANN